MDKWALWLQDKDADLSHSKPTAGLPETARAQLDDFLVLKVKIVFVYSFIVSTCYCSFSGARSFK